MFLSKPDKPLLLNDLCKIRSVFANIVYSAKNLSKSNTFARKVFQHSSNNHFSPSKRYTIINICKREKSYNQTSSFCIFDEN